MKLEDRIFMLVFILLFRGAMRLLVITFNRERSKVVRNITITLATRLGSSVSRVY